MLKPLLAKAFAKASPIPSVDPVIKAHDPIPYFSRVCLANKAFM
jgi:hypothetical protein